MDDVRHQRWIRTAALAGILYFAAGIISGALAGAAASDQLRFLWRLSSFIVSVVVFAAHIAFEHFQLRNTARRAAWHTSVAVALGAFALALAANIHDLGSASGFRLRMVVALVIWPLLTAVPAFIVALAVAAGLGVVTHRRGEGAGK